VCNVTEPHTVTIGSEVTYACHFVYHGTRVLPIVWTGPGVAGAKTNHDVSQSSQQIYNDCYNGKQQVIYINVPTVNLVGIFCHLVTNFDFLQRHACKSALFNRELLTT